MASPPDRASALPLALDLKARLAGIDQKRLRGYRLERLRQQLRGRDYGACLLSDPINIRYATGSRNMMLWTMHSPSRWAFVPVEGPVVLFEYDSSKHVNEGLETIAASPWALSSWPSTASSSSMPRSRSSRRGSSNPPRRSRACVFPWMSATP